MTICMITNNYMPYAGGLVRAIQTYTRELRRQGHTVYIITLDFGVRGDPWFVLRVPSCFRFRYRNNPASVPWRPYRYLYRWLVELQPDIVHIHSPFLLGAAGQKAARRLGIPVIFTYHSLYERFVRYIPVPQRIAQRYVLWSIQRFCQRCDAVVAPSQHIMHRLSSLPSTLQRYCIPTPIRPELMAMPRIRHHSKRTTILSVGRFQPEKQTHHVIDAFARMQISARLVLIGFGASYRYLYWYAYSYWGMSYRDVIFVIHPDVEQLAQWYHVARVFVSASYEAQGIVFAEALAHATPVVAYTKSGAEDTVIHGKHGLLVPHQRAMTEALTRLCQDDAMWYRMRDHAYARGRLYHPRQRVLQLVQAYQSCISYRTL